jgi:very-short-patch-repair endonuclease
VRGDTTIPPRSGEGDRAKRGGGVFATTRRTIDLARQQRRTGNLPEVILWRALRTRPAGFRFRRQHPIGPYCLDFACLSARLAIEIDGEMHSRGDQPQHDTNRDRELATRGFASLRIPARDVLANLQAVVDQIVAVCARRSPLHQPAAGPPPRAGEV